MKLEHVALWTHHLELLREYYVTHFQGKAGPLYHNPAKQFQSYFITFPNGLRLELMTAPAVPFHHNDTIDAQYTGWIHVAFEVDSKEEVERRAGALQRHGYRILDGPRMTGDGYYEFTTLDPDNNRLEVSAKALPTPLSERIQLTLQALDIRLAVCLLAPGTPIPDWAVAAPFWSVTVTEEEMSVVCPEAKVPLNVKAERSWRALRVKGILNFSMSGLLYRLIEPLKNEGIPVFVLSTYRTDYILVRESAFTTACSLLERQCNIEEVLEDGKDQH